jgi:predicted metal-binding membrane protein
VAILTGWRRLNLNVAIGAALLVLAALAWWVLVVQAPGMAMAMEISIPAYMAIWVAMILAMMLPATAPLAVAYGRVARARGGGRLAALPFTAGYLALWAAAGLVPLAVFILSRGAVAGMAASHLGPLALGGVLVAGGLYQLTPWKGACLRACRSPLGFVVSHDFGTGPRGGLVAGAAHGASCLGCCSALMAVLAVTGLMSLPWMAALAVLVLAEKNWRHGVGLSRVAGAGMVLAGIVVAL